MPQTATQLAPPKSIWRRFLILVPLVIALALASWMHIRSLRTSYTVQTLPIMDGVSYDELDIDDITFSNPGVIEAVSVEHRADGMANITFRALADGETDITFGNDRLSSHWEARVVDGSLIVGGVNFSGWEAIHVSFCIVLAALTALFASALISLRRIAWFDYEMVACGGGLLFCLFQFLLFTYLLANQSIIDFYDMSYQISFMADYFVMLTFIPMIVLAVLVSLSNIALIRHEGRRPANLLGIALSVVWLIAIYIWYYGELKAFSLGLPFKVIQVASCLFAVAIGYGECLLLSTIVCGWAASRHTPKHAADYLVILGCGIRDDGTPCPLLAGRVDRAREFDAARIAAGEKPATFVPSGGQGSDEIISEAQSMCNYLVEHGVEPERMVLENRSTNTRENMTFSREVIERHAGRDVSEVSVAFSTTNYHVFRGYVCAHQAGMAVEGMGSKTKAYFWPNAFLREFAGLLVAQWKGILQMFLVIAAVYALAEYVLILA